MNNIVVMRWCPSFGWEGRGGHAVYGCTGQVANMDTAAVEIVIPEMLRHVWAETVIC
jgi:hypothetical protein